jgi:hypothetical protein
MDCQGKKCLYEHRNENHKNGPPLEPADAKGVYRHAFEGQPLDPEVEQRVRERAARVTEEIRRRHGFIVDDTIQAFNMTLRGNTFIVEPFMKMEL